MAIHLANRSADDDDLLLWADLIGGIRLGDPDLPSESAILHDKAIRLDRSLKVKARAQAAGQWSALSEAIFLVGRPSEAIRITEIMYHPTEDPGAEFIELCNIGQEPVDLNYMRFTAGITCEFSPFVLQPQQYAIVVKDIAGFESVYGPGHPVAGQYSGSLDNGGERIRLEDGLGQVVVDFTYDDSWYRSTDGGGYSLVLADPATDSANLSQRQSWRPSARPGGSPGRSDQ
jgi:hypothetical protein